MTWFEIMMKTYSFESKQVSSFFTFDFISFDFFVVAEMEVDLA